MVEIEEVEEEEDRAPASADASGSDAESESMPPLEEADGLSVGSCVVLEGLELKELNGFVGDIIGRSTGDDEDLRLGVRLRGSGKTIAVRPENCRLADAEPEEAFGLPAGVGGTSRQGPVARAPPRAPAGGCCGGGCGPSAGGFAPMEDGEEDEASLKYRALNADLDQEDHSSSRTKARMSFFFLLLTVGPTVGAGILLLQDWLNPLVRNVEPQDAAQVQKIFFGSSPWLVSCVTANTAGGKPPKVLEKAAEQLRAEGVRTARVHCWEPLPTKKGQRTLAQRFGFRKQPPVVMATMGSGKPMLLQSSGLSAEQLAKKALETLASASKASPGGAREKQTASSNGGRREKVGKRPAGAREESFGTDASSRREEAAGTGEDGTCAAEDGSCRQEEEEEEVVDM